MGRTTKLLRLPRMNFVSLVTHGLCAMAVFGDRIGVRMLIATAVLVVLSVVSAMVGWIGFSMGGDPWPTWAFYGVMGLLVAASQMLLFSFLFVFLILTGRNASDFLPVRDHVHFIDGHHVVFPQS